MLALQRQGFSSEQVADLLHAKYTARTIRFRYDLLDKELKFKRTLTNIEDAEVSYSAFSTVKRTAKFRLKEEFDPPRVERTIRTLPFSTYSLSGWTHTNTELVSGAIRAPSQLTNTGTNDSFESGTSGWTMWGTGDWGNGTGIFGYYSLFTRRTNTAEVGIQNTKNLYSVNAGETIYVSFFFKQFYGEASPNYVYGMNAGGNVKVNNGVITNLNMGNWKRFDGSFVVPATTSGAWGLLLGTNGGAVGGVTDYDNAYISKSAPIYEGIATSPIYDISSQTYYGGDIPRVKSVSLDYNQTNPQYAPHSDVWMPYCSLEGRYSENGGSTWSAWSEITPWGSMIGLNMIDARNARMQFRWRYSRYHVNDLPKLNSLKVSIEYDEDIRVGYTDVIDYLTDRIKPYMEIRAEDGTWLSFPLGVFILNSPVRRDGTQGVYREIEAYDLLTIPRDSMNYYVENFFGNVVDNVKNVLNEDNLSLVRKKINIPPLNVSQNFTFPIGTSKLTMANTMLEAIGYTSLWVDADGVFRSEPYVSPASRAVEYTYSDDQLSVIYDGMESEADTFEIPNAWIVTTQNVDGAGGQLISIRRNNTDNKLGIYNIGRAICDYREVDNIANQTALDAYVDRIAQEATMFYGKIKFKTALMPFHENQDVLQINYSPLGIADKFTETSWKMQLKAGGEMEHEARKVVYLE